MWGERRVGRGQAHTLEGVAGAFLVLLGLVFALQVTVVTPLAASTANQHIGNQLEGATTGVLATADDAEELRPAVLFWNESAGRFHGSGDNGHYEWGSTANDFLSRLNATFNRSRIAYNVHVVYLSADGERDSKVMVRSGHPADNAITVSRTVTLYDDDQFRTANGSLGTNEVGETDTYFAPDVGVGRVYNVVRVEVTVWQT